MKFIFWVAGKPKGKGRPRFGRGRTYTPKATVDYERLIQDCLKKEVPDIIPLEGPLSISVTAVFPIPKSWPSGKKELARSGVVWHTARPDSDNILKVVCDALNEIAWHDDSQICLAKISKKYGSWPGLVVVVETISECVQ